MNVHLDMTPGDLAVVIDTAAMKRRQRAMDQCAVLNSEIQRFCHWYPIPTGASARSGASADEWNPIT